MKSMGDPDYVYRPWSEQRRKAASKAALKRIDGNIKQRRKARSKTLREVMKLFWLYEKSWRT